MNAVIYARYSSESQREESIEGQVRECKEYAQRNGMTVIAIYEDHALSARTDDRPDFQRMIRDSENRQFDVVIVWKLDRFSRDRYDSAKYKHILKRNGVKVLSAKENISKGPEGIILESMLEGYAEYYSAELSEKIRRGQKENALKCKNNGGGLPLGYVVDADGAFTCDPLTAPIVTEIFERYSCGAGMNDIDNIVNAIEAGAFNDSLKKRLDELEERKKMLETSIAVEQMARPLLTKDQMLFWLLRFREFDTKSLNTRRQLIDSFLNKVVVYDDKILIVFNYKDTSKQVSFNDIECSDLACSAPPKKRLPHCGDRFSFLF